MVRATILAAGLMMAATAALAGALTDSDYRYLDGQYGLRPDNEIVKGLSGDEQQRLHRLIIDPSVAKYPATRDRNVANFLFRAYSRMCRAWATSHMSPQCPPASDARVEPGKEIADRQCNACHLFGTVLAPPFVKLARQGKASAEELSASLGHGHAMSPITLHPAEIRDLAIYINSLK